MGVDTQGSMCYSSTYVVTQGMAMPTTMQLVQKHTQSLKQRVMYEIVRMMRSNGITISDLTTYEAEHQETVNVLQAIRSKMKLDMLARQAKDSGIIKATANSVYTRSGARKAAEYLKTVGAEGDVNTIFENPTRASSVSHELTQLDNTVGSKDSPAITKSRLVKQTLDDTTEESTPTPVQGSVAPLPPLGPDNLPTGADAGDTGAEEVNLGGSGTRRGSKRRRKVDLADDMPED